jgi:prepilin-type N-terminal cleavage/methylation domain-containing protein
MNKNNEKGFTLVEMLATIVVSSILTMILMQLLMLTVRAEVELETENKLLTESYIVSEKIRDKIFTLEPQEVELISDTSSETIIEVRHLYDYTTNANNEIVPDTSNPVTDTIYLDKINGNIYYNGVQLNSNSTRLGSNTSVSLVALDSTCDFALNACDQGMIELTLEIIIILPNGDTLSPKTYVTTILV